MRDYTGSSVINLRHFRALIAVAELKSFTAAADKLAIVPSALTATINQLEDAVGIKILNRTTRWVEVTDYGEGFVQRAKQIVLLVEKSLDELREVAGIGKGKVTLAGVPSMLSFFVLPTLKKYKEQYPEIEFHLRQETAEVVKELVVSGRVDFGLASCHSDNEELDYQLLTSDTFGAAINIKHPLARKKSTTLDELSQYDLLTLSPENGVRGILDEVFKENNITWGSKIECANSILLTVALIQDLGVTIMPYMAANLPLSSGIKFIKIRDLDIKRELYLITRKRYNLPPASDLFTQFIVAEAKSLLMQ